MLSEANDSNDWGVLTLDEAPASSTTSLRHVDKCSGIGLQEVNPDSESLKNLPVDRLGCPIFQLNLCVAHVREWISSNVSRFQNDQAGIDELMRTFESAPDANGGMNSAAAIQQAQLVMEQQKGSWPVFVLDHTQSLAKMCYEKLDAITILRNKRTIMKGIISDVEFTWELKLKYSWAVLESCASGLT
ncbi:hypothetical protein EV424DRAFT_1351131 [Suillus variegatus]|nr:hypothetical protein EV424DRAFT_1351131 [Suillus variegatus]